MGVVESTPAVDHKADGLTVGQAASSVGVTVRTLHHWDEIALASPSLRSPGGYRLYTADDVARLQRVAIYRELGLSLDAIGELLAEQSDDRTTPLRTQRVQVQQHIQRLQSMATGLDRMIEAHERGILLSTAQQAAIFGADWNAEWAADARDRWGDTPEWAQFAENAATRGPEEWQRVADATAAFESDLARAMREGIEPGSAPADALVERHREIFSAYFALTREMQVCLGRRYEADPEFAAHYDGIHPGLSAWFRRAIDASARAHGIDPDTAIWR
jgi:DNA-binding transcriptional MerR regulator